MSTEAYPLQWPTDYPRTQKRKTAPFKTSFAQARDGIVAELALPTAAT